MPEVNYASAILPQDYVPNTYEELGFMIGKIAEQKIHQVDAENILSVFAKKLPENGDTIEEVVIKLSNSRAYDPTGANALTRKTPNLAVRMYKDWKRKVFDTTVDIPQMEKVLLAQGKGAGRLAAGVVGELYPSDEQEHYEEIRDMLSHAKKTTDGGSGTIKDSLVKFTEIPALTGNKIDYKEVLTAIKNAVSKMKFNNTECNVAGIKRKTKLNDIQILMPYELKNSMDVNELASVFNLDKAEIGKRIIEIDSSKESDYYYIYLIDKNVILDYTRLYMMLDQKNADGAFWNYFLHVERLQGVSPLFDGVYIKVGTKYVAPQNNG